MVRKNATMKMNRFATSFFKFTHCLLSERFSQMMSFGGGAYQTLHLSGLMAIVEWGGLNLGIKLNFNFVREKKSHLKLSMEFL